MSEYQSVLLKLLLDGDSLDSSTVKHAIADLSIPSLARLYVDTDFLQTIMVFLSEQHWLAKKNPSTKNLDYSDFVQSFAEIELSPMSYALGFFKDSTQGHTKALQNKLKRIEFEVLNLVKTQNYSRQKEFATEVLELISKLFELEIHWQKVRESQGEHLGLTLYRTYDSMDEIFNLTYQVDQGMKANIETSERLYEGAGVGVQSGYSTVLTALRHMSPVRGSRFIDLGSGYGRLGLMVGLLRPDIDFIGYEFVQHRVDIAMEAVKNLEMTGHVSFRTQDLSLKEFQIPDAEIYYLYDPFSESTYRHVINQLVSISHRQPITIATKGNARGWLLEVSQAEGWAHPREFHDGNLCLFSSEH
jgi:tRNA G46 methylase TrmB